MEAFFDNKTNIINARVCAVLDGAPMYSLETRFAFQGRVRTVLRDENPLPRAAATVGAINWRERSFEIGGRKKKYEEIRRTEGVLFKKTRYWRWGPVRKEYALSYTYEEWKATLPPSSSPPSSPTASKPPSSKSASDTPDIPDAESTTPVLSDMPDDAAPEDTAPALEDVPPADGPAATFRLPARPHLFSSKNKPRPVLYLSPAALAEDEVFLLLVFVYEEVKRQERTNTSTPGGTAGW